AGKREVMVRVREQFNGAAVALICQLELRREVLQLADAENTQPVTGDGGFSICVGELAKIFVGPWRDRAGFWISTVVEINTADVASLESKANPIGLADTYLLDCLLV